MSILYVRLPLLIVKASKAAKTKLMEEWIMFFLLPVVAGIASAVGATATVTVSAAEIAAIGVATATIIKATKDKEDDDEE